VERSGLYHILAGLDLVQNWKNQNAANIFAKQARGKTWKPSGEFRIFPLSEIQDYPGNF
jgi:hypothetical protein